MDEKVERSLGFIRAKILEYEKLAMVSSFGKDSIVLMYLVGGEAPEMPILWLKPPFLPKATINFAEQVANDWRLNLVVIESEKLFDNQFMQNVVYAPNLPKSNPELCCQIFKVKPIMRVVNELNLQAWFSGLRGTESEKRSMYAREWLQGAFVKLHPLIDWTEADIWRYTAVNKLPVHPWYKHGYRSLGCENCSFPNVWTAERGGRWKDTMMEGGDCGIHCTPMRD